MGLFNPAIRKLTPRIYTQLRLEGRSNREIYTHHYKMSERSFRQKIDKWSQDAANVEVRLMVKTLKDVGIDPFIKFGKNFSDCFLNGGATQEEASNFRKKRDGAKVSRIIDTNLKKITQKENITTEEATDVLQNFVKEITRNMNYITDAKAYMLIGENLTYKISSLDLIFELANQPKIHYLAESCIDWAVKEADKLKHDESSLRRVQNIISVLKAIKGNAQTR